MRHHCDRLPNVQIQQELSVSLHRIRSRRTNAESFPSLSPHFRTAYQLIKRFHPNIELDRFFITQLYEYEPILQVQRTQSAGNSCSRELRGDLLKRKKVFDDYCYHAAALMPTIMRNPIECSTDHTEQADILME